MIQRLHHTGFVVENLEKAVEFYRDVVGLEVLSRYERTGPAIDQIVGYDNAHLQIALVSAGGDHLLELILYLSPPPNARPTEERNVTGATHLAFQVDDIQATFRRLVSNGAREMNPPAEVAPGRIGCYLQDPDGNWLELLQIQEG